MNNDKVLSLMGLAKKAGKLKSGEYCVENEIKKGKAVLVIVALDASENTKKKYSDMCAYRKVPICFWSEKEKIGNILGNGERAAADLSDEGFAKGIMSEIERQNNQINKPD